jgi:hypothetical protein
LSSTHLVIDLSASTDISLAVTVNWRRAARFAAILAASFAACADPVVLTTAAIAEITAAESTILILPFAHNVK